MNENRKLCIDCAYFRYNRYRYKPHQCCYPTNLDSVSANPIHDCHFLRSRHEDRYCGEDAKWFAPKPPEKEEVKPKRKFPGFRDILRDLFSM